MSRVLLQIVSGLEVLVQIVSVGCQIQGLNYSSDRLSCYQIQILNYSSETSWKSVLVKISAVSVHLYYSLFSDSAFISHHSGAKRVILLS